MFKKYLLLLSLSSCLILFGCSKDPHELTVAIQPYGHFEKSFADTIRLSIEKTYGVKTYLFKPTKIPEETFINTKSPRYRADKIIALLKKQKPDSLDFIIGLMPEDISMTKREAGKIKEPKSKYEDWGVFGLGYMPGPSSVVSSYRLKETSRKILVERLKKVAVHELGHNMGLEHCSLKECVMTDAAESIKTVDHAGSQLCNQCKRKITE